MLPSTLRRNPFREPGQKITCRRLGRSHATSSPNQSRTPKECPTGRLISPRTPPRITAGSALSLPALVMGRSPWRTVSGKIDGLKENEVIGTDTRPRGAGPSRRARSPTCESLRGNDRPRWSDIHSSIETHSRAQLLVLDDDLTEARPVRVSSPKKRRL